MYPLFVSKALFIHANLSWRPSSTLPFLRQFLPQPFSQIHLKMYCTLLGVYQIFFKRLIYSSQSRLILNVHATPWLVLEMLTLFLKLKNGEGCTLLAQLSWEIMKVARYVLFVIPIYPLILTFSSRVLLHGSETSLGGPNALKPTYLLVLVLNVPSGLR